MSKPATKLLGLLTAAVFITELSIMAAFTLLPHLPQWFENFVDASLLVTLLFPILYFRVFKPLNSLANQQMAMKAELASANERLQQDLVERGRIEEALRESESKFRLLFEFSNDCILILDLNGRIVDINHTGHERLGYEKEEMLGKYVSQFDSPEFAPKVPERIAELKAHGYALFESAHVRKDGSQMPVEINTKIVQLNGQNCILSNIRDITRRKEMDNALRISESRYRGLFETTKDGILILNFSSGEIEDINPYLAEMLGYTCNELIGQKLKELGFKKNSLINDDSFLSLQKKGYLQRDEVIETKHGKQLDIELISNIYECTDKYYIQCNIRDITNRTRRLNLIQEEERRRLAQELHDRTSPNLAALKINLDHVLTMLPVLSNNQLKYLVDDMIALLDDTNHSIRDISAELRPHLLDLAGLWPALNEYARNYSLRTGIAVDNKANHLDIKFLPDIETNLFRIFQEALTNSAKHSQARRISIRFNEDSAVMRFAICDNGKGFDPDSVDTISGHGLSSMRDRADFIGGTFKLETSTGKGTCIYVTIPKSKSIDRQYS